MQERRLTDSALRAETIEHLRRFVVLRFQAVAFVADYQSDRWDTCFDVVAIHQT